MMLKVINPATEELIAEIPQDSPESIGRKFERAVQAQEFWAQIPLTQRIDVMRNFRELLVSRAESLAGILTREMGKPIRQSRNELAGVLGRIDFFIENVADAIRQESVHHDPEQGLEERIVYEPLGVIANISAWNYPYFVGSNVFVPALLTGNAVLYKPSEFATLTGIAIAELLREAGVPEDVFVPVIGGGYAGARLLELPMAAVYFTGSYSTGRKIAEIAAKHLVKAQLELGGKDPVYVCDDVDVRAAVEATADGAFYNTGQSCCSVERIYVHEKIYDEFVQGFVGVVRNFALGDPMDSATYIGPLARAAQLEVLGKQVEDAREKGAQLLLGGGRILGKKGFYFKPTVLANVSHSMSVMRDESFGPIIGIQKVRKDSEALELMNDTAYGLTAGIYTRDRERAERILKSVNAGSAYWNCCDRVSPRLPWSGRKNSGMGSTLSKLGIQAFVQPKAWHLRQG